MDTERRLERYRQAANWPTDEALHAMLDNQHAALVAVHEAIPQLEAAVEAATRRLRREEGRLIYCGAGSSGRLAVQDGVELLPTFGWPSERLHYAIAGGEAALVRSIEGAEDDAEAGEEAMLSLGIRTDDVVISLAASGRTRYTVAAQNAAREAGALAIGMACNPDTPLLIEADHPVLLHTGAEFLAGSTRMTAGTAQKIALNLFSTQLMTALGRVYDGFMVQVQASNAKLQERARRITQVLTGGSDVEAAQALAATGNDIRLAVIMSDGANLVEARELLERCHGDLGRARALARQGSANIASEGRRHS